MLQGGQNPLLVLSYFWQTSFLVCFQAIPRAQISPSMRQTQCEHFSHAVILSSEKRKFWVEVFHFAVEFAKENRPIKYASCIGKNVNISQVETAKWPCLTRDVKYYLSS